MTRPRLLTIGQGNVKTFKSKSHGYLTGILHLAPAEVSGVINACPAASEGCRLACLNKSGRGQQNQVQKARIYKTRMYAKNPERFMRYLREDIEALVRKCEREGFLPAVRLNGTSDLDFTGVIQSFPGVEFYDYTKRPDFYAKYLKNELPENYTLVFSRSEVNEKLALKFLGQGGTVAVVFDTLPEDPLPHNWHGYKVIDGDGHDLRFLDAKRKTVIGLRPKGIRARTDDSGFVVKT